MQKNTIAKKIDLLSVSVTLYLLLFILYSSLFEGVFYCLILSALSLFILYLLYFIATKKSREKFRLKKEDEKHSNEIFLNLPLLKNECLKKFLLKLFEKAGYECSEKGSILIAAKDNVKRAIYTCFGNTAKSSDIYNAEQGRLINGADGFMLLCEKADDESYALTEILNNKNNCIICKMQLYCGMKKYNCFPDIIYKNEQKKKVLKEIFAYAFARSRFKSYFLLALIMFAFSYISPFKTYYLIFAALLFLFCVFSLINKKYNAQIIKEGIF